MKKNLINEENVNKLQDAINSYVNSYDASDPLHPIIVSMIAHFISNSMKEASRIFDKSPNNSITGRQVLRIALDSLRKTADDIESKFGELRATDKKLV